MSNLTNDKENEMNTQAGLEGYKAYEDYQHLSDCPYSYMTETNEAYQWSEGFKEAMREGGEWYK